MQFQQQRAMERGIRAAKRECMMLQETGDTEGLQKASLRLRNQREKYRAYCKETGLKQHNDRTQVYGYDRSKSSKTVWAERKAKEGSGDPLSSLASKNRSNALTNNNNSDIIMSGKQFGKKIGKHAEDYGLDASKEADRQKMKDIINNIHNNKDEIRVGSFCGQPNDVNFFIKGDDVVICKPSGEFVTIMKGGVNNEWVKNARKQ